MTAPVRHRSRAAALALLLVAAGQGCGDSPKAAPPVPVRLGLALQGTGALPMVAAHEKFFLKQNLLVKIETYISGKRAMEGLLRGDVDAVTTAEVPIVFSSFKSRDFSVLASVATAAGQHSIVARRDAGIQNGADLKGKRVGTQRGSAVHFFLHLFLLGNRLSEDDVTIEYMKGELLPRALSDGRIDAFSMREPYVGEAKALLGHNVIVFPDEGIYTRTENLVVSARLLEEQRGAVDRILLALLEAEQFVIDHPERAQKITAKTIGADPKALSTSWRNLNPRVFLDQSLIASLEHEADWAIHSGLTDASEIPDYLDVIAMESLSDLRPEAVTIIR